MIDENILIKVFENRIDTFLKQHPDQKDCVAVQGQREIIQLIEAEAKRQEAERREHIKSFECKLLGRLDDIKESKEAFCDEQEEKCGLYDSCFNCLIGGIVDLIKQLEDEQEYSYANFDDMWTRLHRTLMRNIMTDFVTALNKQLWLSERLLERKCRG